jgi:hypothetical protein
MCGRTLRSEFHFELACEILLFEELVLTHVAADHALYLAGL